MGACIRCAQFEIEYDRALRTIASLTAERDALAAAMPSEGSDAALAYAAMKAERDALNVKVAELETTLSTVWEAITAFGSKR